MEPFHFSYFDEKIDRRGTACEKWDILQREEGPDMLPMWVADMDFRSPPAIQEAIIERAMHGVYGYTVAEEEDTAALMAFWKRRHALEMQPDWVVMLPCIVTGMRLAVQALTKPGEGVIIQTPVYGPFFSAVEQSGRRLMTNPLRYENGAYRMDLTHLEDRLQGGGKLLMLCNPHNPVGRAWTRKELQDVLALCAQYDATIVTDEIHADFVYPDRVHVPLLSLPGAHERVVMLCSASKTFNVAGLQQASCVVPHPDLRKVLRQQAQNAGVVSGNLFALAATRAAYTQGDAWLDGLIPYLAAGRDLVLGTLAESLPHIHALPLEATYLMWLDCSALGADDDELERRTRRVARVALSPGGAFGAKDQGFLRLNIGCPHAQLQESLRRLERALRAG